MKNNIIYLLGFLLIIAAACNSNNPNITKSGEDEFTSLELDRALKKNEKKFEHFYYVPIYSDIYLNKTNQNSLLAATLSIRNTSFNDSLFVSLIDYYNTEGELVRNYIDQPILLTPMATVNYVIEKEDTSGGPGANFIIKCSSDKENLKPLIQAVMVGVSSNKGYAFSTDAYEIYE